MVTERGAWSDDNLHSRWMVWLSSLTVLYLRNMRLITEFEFWSLSEYLVRTELVGYNSPSERESL